MAFDSLIFSSSTKLEGLAHCGREILHMAIWPWIRYAARDVLASLLLVRDVLASLLLVSDVLASLLLVSLLEIQSY